MKCLSAGGALWIQNRDRSKAFEVKKKTFGKNKSDHHYEQITINVMIRD
jgi:hypothetical protein